VIVMEAAPLPPDSDDDAITAALVAAIQSGATRKAAVATVTADLGVQKRRVFDIATSLPRHEAPR
jgi:hypothetical protein